MSYFCPKYFPCSSLLPYRFCCMFFCDAKLELIRSRVFVYVCGVYVCACKCMFVCMWRAELSSLLLSTLLLEPSLELISLTEPARKPRDPSSSASQGVWLWTGVLRSQSLASLAWQVLYPLSHSPALYILF